MFISVIFILLAATSALSSTAIKTIVAKKSAQTLESNTQQRKKDLKRLQQLLPNANNNLQSCEILVAVPTTSNTTKMLPNIKLINSPTHSVSASQQISFPLKLKQEGFSFDTSPIFKHSKLAKDKALETLKKKPIPIANPNFIKYRGTEQGKKRAHDALKSPDDQQKKKQKLTKAAEVFQKERIRKIMEAKSSHSDLIEAHEQATQDRYFDSLEKKEAMEEKMLSTFTVACKAVVCLRCRYTALSAADRCKQERHQLKIIDAKKRFYECTDCGNRTITVHRMPQMSCKNCQSSRWKRTAMIKDRKALRIGEHLSIRGDEETYLGSLQSYGNANLCVPTD